MSTDTIRNLINNICASLWVEPATENELINRDFLSKKSLYGIQKLIQSAESLGLIYLKGNKYHCYRSTLKRLNKEGYDL
jgi:hypothetical protein